MQDILSALKGMSRAELKDAVAKARAFMNTPDGKEVMNRLQNGRSVEGLPVTSQEQSRLMAQLAKDPDVAKKLGEALKN